MSRLWHTDGRTDGGKWKIEQCSVRPENAICAHLCTISTMYKNKGHEEQFGQKFADAGEGSPLFKERVENCPPEEVLLPGLLPVSSTHPPPPPSPPPPPPPPPPLTDPLAALLQGQEPSQVGRWGPAFSSLHVLILPSLWNHISSRLSLYLFMKEVTSKWGLKYPVFLPILMIVNY